MMTLTQQKHLLKLVISRCINYHCPHAKRVLFEMLHGLVVQTNMKDKDTLHIETMSGELYKVVDILKMDTVLDVKKELGVLCELFDMNSTNALKNEFKLNDLIDSSLIIVFDTNLIELDTYSGLIDIIEIIEIIENSYHSQYNVRIYNEQISKEHLQILGTVDTLTLHGCNNLVDVSALGSVHTLTIVDCRDVVDVSALGSVHTLTLNN